MIYLDHAATTFPRPQQVLETMFRQYAREGCSPGRGGQGLKPKESFDWIEQFSD